MAAINFTILDSGNLRLSVKDRETFEDIVSKEYYDERHYLADFMEDARLIGNDWDCLYDVGMTETPAIGQGLIYCEDENDNDGYPVDFGNLWYFPDYMIYSYIGILREKGEIIFTRHCN